MLRGFSYVPQGFRLLGTPGLRRYVVVPVAVNIVVFIGLFWLGAAGFREALDWLLPDPAPLQGSGFWGEILAVLTIAAQWLLWPLFLLAGVVLVFYTFTLAANLIAAPFNGMLSARVEQQITGTLPAEVPSGSGLLLEVAGSVFTELRKFCYFLLLAIPALALFLIPGLNLFAPLVWTLVGAWILALEYADYPLGNRGIAFADQRVLLRTRRGRHLGFGLGVLGMTLIPGINLLAMPTAVIGATLLHCDLEKPGGSLSRPAQPPARR